MLSFKNYDLRKPNIKEARELAEWEKSFFCGNSHYCLAAFYYCHENELFLPVWVSDYMAASIKRFFENVGKPGYQMEGAFLLDKEILKTAGKITQQSVDGRANDIRFLFGLKSKAAFDVSFRTYKLFAENNQYIFYSKKEKQPDSAYQDYCKNWNIQRFNEYQAKRIKKHGEPTEEQREQWIKNHRVDYNAKIINGMLRTFRRKNTTTTAA